MLEKMVSALITHAMNIDLEKILIRIVMALVIVYVFILMTCSCRSSKQVAKVETQTEIKADIVEESKTETQYDEYVFVVDSAKEISINELVEITKGKGKEKVKIKEIKVKKATETTETKIEDKSVVKEELKSETKEKQHKRDLWFIIGLVIELIVIVSVVIFIKKIQ